MTGHLRRLGFVVVVALPLASCQCRDTVGYGWELSAPVPDVAEVGADAEADGGPDADPGDVGDAHDVRDVADVVDVRDGRRDIDTWQPEEIMPVECTERAQTDRTSLVIDDEGTLWLGHHRYEGPDCEHSTLVVNRKRLRGRWVREDIQPHEGIFALSIIERDRPIVVYPDPPDGSFKVAHRFGDRDWRFHPYDLEGHHVGRWDGFDLTNDGRRFFVSFAGDGASQLRLFSYDTQAADPSWQTRRSLSVHDPQAAMERGLRADTDDSVYLVHRDDRDRFGVARYDKHGDVWAEREYLDQRNQGYVHSFIIRDDFELCMSSRLDGRLLVTCGTMFDLQQDRTLLDQRIPDDYPTSLIEGDDGTLYVAFHPPDNDELRVAKRPPGGEWSVRTVFDQPSFGVSTAIDGTGDLVLGFYTCDEAHRRCSLRVIRERPDEL